MKSAIRRAKKNVGGNLRAVAVSTLISLASNAKESPKAKLFV
jgi:hypothetical protein